MSAGKMIAVLSCLVCCLVAGSCLAEKMTIELPSNEAEKQSIEKFFARFDNGNDLISTNLFLRVERRLKLWRISKAKDEEARAIAKHHFALVDQYIKFAKLNEQNCDPGSIDQYAFLLKYHEGSEAITKYLRHHASAQFSFCKTKWDSRLVEAVWRYDDNLREVIESIARGFMPRRNGNEPPYEPYSDEELKTMIERPRPAGVSEWMRSMLYLQFDANGKNRTVDWDFYLKRADWSVVEASEFFCRKIRPAANIYQVVLDPTLQISLHFEKTKTARAADRWYKFWTLTCKLIDIRKQLEDDLANKRPNLYRQAFDELTN